MTFFAGLEKQINDWPETTVTITATLFQTGMVMQSQTMS